MKCIIYCKVIKLLENILSNCAAEKWIFSKSGDFLLCFDFFNINPPWMSLRFFFNRKSTMINLNIFFFIKVVSFDWAAIKTEDSCDIVTLSVLWHKLLTELLIWGKKIPSCLRSINYCLLIYGWWFSWTSVLSRFCEFQVPWDRRLWCLKWKIMSWDATPLVELQTAGIWLHLLRPAKSTMKGRLLHARAILTCFCVQKLS